MLFDHTKIPLLSFFTGGGFLDMGFERTGNFETIWTNECDPVFAKFYESGFSSWLKSTEQNASPRSITNISKIQELTCDQIKEEAFGNIASDFFGIIGGPPCQDFSSMGKKNGFDGDRGKLTKEFLQKIMEIHPSFFIMENVVGLINIKNNKQVFLDHLESLQNDYYLDHFILNALHYGTPQFRERVFVVGILKQLVHLPDTRFLTNKGWFPQPVKIYPDALSWKLPTPNLFGQVVEKDGDVPSELCVEHHLVPDTEILNIPNANEYFKLRTNNEKLCKIKEGETNRQSFKRLHRFKYSPTVCYGNNEVHLHPYRQRRLSVREALRLQGVPDSYTMDSAGQLTKKFKMIGNGVPVPLAEAVAKAMLRFFENIDIARLPSQFFKHYGSVS
jgi:DNA (cytosine-5)-methyltransferase 1